MADTVRLITPVFRMSFVNVVTPKAYRDPKTNTMGNPLFSTNMILKPEELKQFKTEDANTKTFVDISVADIAIAEVKKSWPTQVDSNEKLQAFINALKITKKWPFLDGDELANTANGKSEFTRGMKVVKASSSEKVAPNLFLLKGKEKVPLRREVPTEFKTATDLFHAGSYAYAEITPASGTAGGQPYVKFYLNAMVFVKRGERIGGGDSLIGRFDGISGGEDTQTDPTKGMSEEIAF